MVYIGGDREGESGLFTLDQWALLLSMILNALQAHSSFPNQERNLLVSRGQVFLPPTDFSAKIQN